MLIQVKPQVTLPPLKVGITAEPKYGKTRLATSLPWDEFGDKAAYVCWDEGAEDLSPVLFENRDHLITVKQSAKLVHGKWLFDPHKEAIAIASKSWSTGFKDKQADGTEVDIPPVQTLIWDTMTETGRNILSAYADSGIFAGSGGDKHVSVGEQGTPYYMAAPMQGDYGLAQRACQHILRMLFKHPINVIVLFHPENTENEGAGNIGPATVGKAGIKPVASMFDNLFVLNASEVPVPGNPPTRKLKRQLYTDKRGQYLAGLRCPYPKNPIPVLDVTENPTDVWRTINQVRRGEYK